MSLDRSLKAANSLQRHRNVLSRAERIARLTEEERWSASDSIFALPKVANRKASVGGKAKAKAATEETPTAEEATQ
jgi:small basic protein (TIGR04137 family)